MSSNYSPTFDIDNHMILPSLGQRSGSPHSPMPAAGQATENEGQLSSLGKCKGAATPPARQEIMFACISWPGHQVDGRTWCFLCGITTPRAAMFCGVKRNTIEQLQLTLHDSSPLHPPSVITRLAAGTYRPRCRHAVRSSRPVRTHRQPHATFASLLVYVDCLQRTPHFGRHHQPNNVPPAAGPNAHTCQRQHAATSGLTGMNQAAV